MSDFTAKDVVRVYLEKEATLALAGCRNSRMCVLDDLAGKIGEALAEQAGLPYSIENVFRLVTANVPLEERARDLYVILASWIPGQ